MLVCRTAGLTGHEAAFGQRKGSLRGHTEALTLKSCTCFFHSLINIKHETPFCLPIQNPRRKQKEEQKVK